MWKHAYFTLAILIFATTGCAPARQLPTASASPTEVSVEPTMSEYLKAYLAPIPTIDPNRTPLPTRAPAEPTMSEYLRAYLAPIPTIDPNRTPLPTEAPAEPTMNPYLEAYLAPIPTIDPNRTPLPTDEVSLTPKEVDFSGPVRVNEHIEGYTYAENFLKRRNSILKAIKENNGKIPRDLFIPLYVLRLDDDPTTPNITEGYYAVEIYMQENDLYRIYVRYLGLPQEVYKNWLENKTPNESIEKLRDRAFLLYLSPKDGPEDVFQGGLWDKDLWSLGPNEMLVLGAAVWTKDPATKRDRDGFKKISGFKQPIVKPTKTPTAVR